MSYKYPDNTFHTIPDNLYTVVDNVYQIVILDYLHQFANGDGKCFPSIDKLIDKKIMSKPIAYKTITELEEKNFISVERSTGRVNKYTVNYDFIQSTILTSQPRLPVNDVNRSTTFTSTSKPRLPVPVNHVYPNQVIEPSNNNQVNIYKEKVKKENVKNLIELPEFIDKELWRSFIDMRKKIKKPATDKAQELLIKKLTGYYQDGENINQILENSIINSWQGLFSIKNKNYPTGNTQNSKPRFNDNKRDILTYGQEKPHPFIEDAEKVRIKND